MNDERFFDLAMKVIVGQATDPERADLDALLARDPDLRAEFLRLEADARVAKNALPLVEAAMATAGELPAYARGRLQTKVRQTFGRPEAEKESGRSLTWGWRWVLGLAAAAAAVVLVVLPILRTSNAPLVQLAMLDRAGAIRGSDTHDVALLRETWKTAKLVSFASADLLRQWERDWSSNRQTVKIIYDPAAAEVRVVGKRRGKLYEKTFLVEPNLPATLRRVKSFLLEQAPAQ